MDFPVFSISEKKTEFDLTKCKYLIAVGKQDQGL